MTWQAVTFYTLGTGYEREVQRLRKSAESLGIPLKSYAYASRGSWRQNLNYKSECILRAMDEHPAQDIVFVDADAVIRAYPTKFDELSERGVYDIAAHFFQWRPTSVVELLSGTLWIANTDKGRAVVEAWHKAGIRHPEMRHQRCLQSVVAALDARVYRLPIEYTCIFDAPSRKGRAAVIEHFQASRKYRRLINTHSMSGKSRHTGPNLQGPIGCVR